MGAKTCFVGVRVSERDLANIDRTAGQLGVTRSQLLRTLSKLDARIIDEAASDTDTGAARVYLITKDPCKRLTRAIVSHGYLYNQVAYALNRIKNNRSIPLRVVREQLEPALSNIEELARRMDEIEAEWEVARARLVGESIALM